MNENFSIISKIISNFQNEIYIYLFIIHSTSTKNEFHTNRKSKFINLLIYHYIFSLIIIF